MKIDRHGQAKILTQSEIQLLFSQGLQSHRDRALFGICLYCCCRINEACTLNVNDVYSKGKVRPELLIRKGNTKGKLATRSIPVIEDLRVLLITYQQPDRGYLFPGRWGKGHINSDSAARILREAMNRVGIEGGSTHSSYFVYQFRDSVTRYKLSNCLQDAITSALAPNYSSPTWTTLPALNHHCPEDSPVCSGQLAQALPLE